MNDIIKQSFKLKNKYQIQKKYRRLDFKINK